MGQFSEYSLNISYSLLFSSYCLYLEVSSYQVKEAWEKKAQKKDWDLFWKMFHANCKKNKTTTTKKVNQTQKPEFPYPIHIFTAGLCLQHVHKSVKSVFQVFLQRQICLTEVGCV